MKRAANCGFGLIEVLASVAIMGGALLIAFDVIDHALRVFGESTAMPGNQHTIATEIAIRRDIQGAEALPEVGASSTGELVLSLQDGRRVEWRREGSALVRSEIDGDLASVETRPLPRHLTGWQWKVVSPTLLEVQIEVEVSPTATGLHQTGRPDRRVRRETRVIWVSPRGARGEGTW